MESPIPGLYGSGPYAANWNSLLNYEAPEWYQDAEFGIWAHWSPQCVPEKGDWYARNMYVEGSEQYKFHLEHYGHPSNFGYKDLCPQWSLLNWEPEELVDRYKKAGARFIFALANHHDGFDCWDSKHHPLERSKDRAASRCGWNMGEAGKRSRAEIRRNRASGQKLVVV